MFTQLPHSSTARLLAALAVALSLGIASTAKPASADVVEWQRQQPHWAHQSNGWKRQWPTHHRNQFSNRSQVIIGGGSGIIIVGPGFVVGNPGSTQRLLTQDQLAFQREVALPITLATYSELRGRLLSAMA